MRARGRGDGIKLGAENSAFYAAGFGSTLNRTSGLPRSASLYRSPSFSV